MSAKRPHPRIAVLVRFEPHELAMIDAARGETMTRQEWIAGAALGVSRHIGRKVEPAE